MIQFKRPETKTDFKQLSVTIGKAIIDGVAANPFGIASNAVDAIASAFGEQEQTAETQA